MARVRWFTAKWPISLRALGAKMKAAEFNEQSTDGFILERTRDAVIEGQYIEKRLLEDVTVDPFGNEQRTEFVDYRRVCFLIGSEFPEIQVMDAPRNIQGFVSRLAELNKFTLAIGPVDVNLVKWSELLSETDEFAAEVTAIQAGEIAFPDGVVGKIFLRGERAREVMKQLVKSRKHSIERVVVRVTTDRSATSVHLCKGGAATFGATADDSLINLVRECLRIAASK